MPGGAGARSLYDGFDFYNGHAPESPMALAPSTGVPNETPSQVPAPSTAAMGPPLCPEASLSEDDIEMVMVQAAVGRAVAVAALRASNGDMMDACLKAADV